MVWLRDGAKSIRLAPRDIVWIASAGNYIEYSLADGANHLIRGTLDLEDIQMLVFDEADRMLSMGFYPDMKEIQNYLPRRSFNACMFSATFPLSVIQTAREFIREPEFISLSGDHVHETNTEHVSYLVPPMDKDRCLVRIIEIENR